MYSGFAPATGWCRSARNVSLQSMGVVGPMARTAPRGYVALNPSWLRCAFAAVDGRGRDQISRTIEDRSKRQANCLGRRLKGYLLLKLAVLDVCKAALKTFESMGCIVEEAQPKLRSMRSGEHGCNCAWQAGGALLAFYNDPAKRALMKPEAIFEVESGLKLSAFDIQPLHLCGRIGIRPCEILRRIRLFRPSDRQLFPFDANVHWPQEIAGRRIETHNEWKKGVLPITMSGVQRLPPSRV